MFRGIKAPGYSWLRIRIGAPHPGLLSAVRVPMYSAWGENLGKQRVDPRGYNHPSWPSSRCLSLLWTP